MIIYLFCGAELIQDALYMKTQLKQKTLELQIADLKTKQCEEKLNQEQSQIKSYAEQISQLLSTEKNLRLQLTADGEKFQQFQVGLEFGGSLLNLFRNTFHVRLRIFVAT